MKIDYTFIIPTLNEEHYIWRLLDSIKNQIGVWDYEVYVVDGGSTDRTSQIVRRYIRDVKSLHFITTKANISHQRNTGAQKARGKWLLFIDADTVILPEFLSIFKEYTDKHPQSVFMTSLSIPDSDKAADRIVVGIQKALFYTGSLLKCYIAPGMLTAIRSDIFRKIGRFDESYTFSEDVEITSRMVKSGYRLDIILTPLYVWCLRRFRTHGYLKTSIIYARALFMYFIQKSIPQNWRGYTTGGHNYGGKNQP